MHSDKPADNDVPLPYMVKALMSSGGDKTQKKAIYSIREMYKETKGIACAVKIKGSVQFLTWCGVIGENDCNKTVEMDRYCSKYPEHIKKHGLIMKDDIREEDGFTFLLANVNDNAGSEIDSLDVKVPGNETKTSDLVAYSFTGTQTFSLPFKYDESERKYRLDVGSDVLKNGMEVKYCSVIGSPIIIEEDNRKVVVGVVGASANGDVLCPYFITESVLSPRPSQTEESQSKASCGPAPRPSQTEESQSEAFCGPAPRPMPTEGSDPPESVASRGSETFKQEKQIMKKQCNCDVVDTSNQAKEQKEASKDKSKLVTGQYCIQETSKEESRQIPHTPAPVKNGTVSKDILPDLAFDVQSVWKPLGGALHLHEARLTSIETDVKNDVYEQTIGMLYCWLQSGGSRATYAVLSDALQDIDANETRCNYCEVGHSPSRSPSDIPENLRAGIVSVDVLRNVSKDVTGKWKRLGRILGIKESKLRSIEGKHHHDICEHSLEMMIHWRQSKYSNATYEELAKALLHRTVDMRDVVEKLLTK